MQTKHITYHTKSRQIARWFIVVLLCSLTTTGHAQCTFRNTAFKSGEYLSYNLYYNWKFVWVKAGTASMSTVESNYKGKAAWRASLTTRGNKRVLVRANATP